MLKKSPWARVLLVLTALLLGMLGWTIWLLWMSGGTEVVDERLLQALVTGALILALSMIVAHLRAGDFRRAATLQAEQNEQNQQAILRLLDELSSLADGNLTVHATVTDDITGAIADPINYAIGALRDLVATVNNSSILVDAAAKQTEAASQHLVRASETQTKHAAAASESIEIGRASCRERV